MNHLVIGIPTYKRPLLLEKLINSIYKCNVDSNFICEIDIVIVDNDISKTAENTASKFKNIGDKKFKLHYHNYPKKGLSNVRNKLIEKANEFDPDYIVFVDDDVYVTHDWLNELVYCIVKNNCDIAMGPYFPEFEKKVSSAISHWFFRPNHDNDAILDFIITGNLIMRSKFLKDNQLQFDPRFNTTGAEDSYFGISVLKKNGIIRWAANAIAYETIPEKRTTLKWLLKRKYNGANTYMSTMILEKCHKKIFIKLIVSFINLPLGFFCLIGLPFKFKYRYFGLLRIAEGLGGIAGLMNIKFHAYSEIVL